MSDKFDAPLRLKLRQFEAAGRQDTRLAVFVETVDGLAAQQRGRLVEAGLDVQTVAGRIVAATGTPTAIHEAASLDFVRSLSLSQTRARDRP